MDWLILCVSAYVAIGIATTILIRIVDDPYEHFSSWQDWKQAILYGVGWLPFLAYVIGVAM